MEIPSKYTPHGIEDRLYSYWMKNGFFRSVPDKRDPYTIVIPPPNVTGVLHMGHMLNNTIQDILVRRARMQGKNACWVPGTDHASIATEAKVVAKLEEEGIKKSDLTRDEFLRHAWEWKEKHGGIILEQLKKLGASCDWDRTCFTMDEKLSSSVIKVFVDLYNKGYIYKGVRVVNWDPQAKTAVSDEEVIYKEENSKLYYVRYKIADTDNEWVTIATTRPETILGDTAVCVNPNDKRYRYLKDKKVLVPLVNRPVPVIFDEYVDIEFGTGCLKITPAHDANDYEIGLRHNLETIDIFNADGSLNEAAIFFIGKDRFEARELIITELEKAGNLVKVEDYINKVGYSERTDVVIEPRLSAQWFIKMKDISKPALDNVMNHTIKFYPSKYKNLYRHWMENIKDWCISRQLWWGHRIPVYYLADGSYVVAETAEKALEMARQKAKNPGLKAIDLKQDEDVLDTWASSWIWPISVFDGINNPDNEDIKYYYPTNDLITAPEIIFFWVARMIIAGYEYRREMPFRNVYFTGIVRDKLHRKMSKSLGNSPDPLHLIKKYGADGVRVGMLLCSPAGNDLLFEESLTEQGRNFANKIWNVFRLVKSWQISETVHQSIAAKAAIEWFDAKLNQSISIIDDHFSKFRISEALMVVYTLIKDEFSGWYLESVKPAFQQPMDAETFKQTSAFFEKLLKVLHPFMPFISEEIYQLLEERKDGDSIMISQMPDAEKYSKKILNAFDEAKEVISFIRTARVEKQIPNKETRDLIIKSDSYKNPFIDIVIKLGNVNYEVSSDSVPIGRASSLITNKAEYYFLYGDEFDSQMELKRLEKDLEDAKGFIEIVEENLNNESFIKNAPEWKINNEKQKKADADAKIKTLEEQIRLYK
jgi:valyl-tRNA synthetase